MDVSVIIVNYNTVQLTQKCIESVVKTTEGLDYEIVLVDNASRDGSVEKFSQDSRIKFIQSDTNLGFGKANNLGLHHSTGKYIFFLNSDTLLLNNAIKLFYDFMEANGTALNVGAVGTLLMDANEERAHSYSKLPTIGDFFKAEWGDHILKRFGKRMPRYDENVTDPDRPYFPVGYVTGADLFCARRTIEQCGAFDPDFFMYSEESEMQFRWKKHNLNSYILRGPQIIHLEGASQKKMSVSKSFMTLRSQLLYFKKTSPRWEYYIYRILLLVSRLLTLPMQKLTCEERREYLRIITR